MGMKLIDADLLMHWVEKLEAYNVGRTSCFKKPKGLTPEGMRHMIDTMPTVDAVPVVRCKDCKWWKEYHCTNINGAFGVVENENWFCCSGERKDND